VNITQIARKQIWWQTTRRPGRGCFSLRGGLFETCQSLGFSRVIKQDETIDRLFIQPGFSHKNFKVHQALEKQEFLRRAAVFICQKIINFLTTCETSLKVISRWFSNFTCARQLNKVFEKLY